MEEQEIDLIEVVRKLWRRRKMVLLIVLGFTCVGISVALWLPREYTAECTMGLEVEDNAMRVKLEGLSALQSMNMGDVRESRVITPAVYPNILYSAPFQKELMHKNLILDGSDSISFYNYFVKHYGKAKNSVATVSENNIQQFTSDEERCLNFLKKKINLKIVTKDGYLKLTVDMPQARLAAQIAQQVETMLQQYITEFKIAKAQASLDFIENRYTEVKADLENKQQALMTFRENNKGRASIQLETEEKILTNDYELFFSLYADIVKQREKAKIQVKQNMPVLTVLEPVVLPSTPAKPKRVLIILASAFLGLFIGCGVVLSMPVVKHIVKRN